MKTKKLINYISLFIIHYSLFIILISCDKVEPPYTKQSSSTKADSTTYKTHVLLEEFTGCACGNCPAGQAIVDSLENLYPTTLISYEIHAGYFAELSPPTYTVDYTTTVGNALNTYFDIQNNPSALINRINTTNGKVFTSTADWGNEVATLVNVPPNIDLILVNTYVPGTLNLTSTVYVHTLDTINQPLVLSVYIIEDSLKSNQNDDAPTAHVIPNYVHRNVLRGSLNGTWGTPLQNGALQKNQYIVKSYNYTLNPAWKYWNVYTVAFVYNLNTGVILQCEKAKIF